MKLLNFLKIKTYWFFAFEYKKDGKTFHSELVVHTESYFWENVDVTSIYLNFLNSISEVFKTEEIRIRQFNRV
ncbi:TPA: hypothetical protein ACX8VE_001450 [Campylobacter jejuni]